MTGFSYTPGMDAEDKRNRKISLVATAVIFILFTIASLIWTVYRERVPPPGEKQYEVVGAIDFGSFEEGSRDVNNFEEPIPDPAEAPPEPQPEPQTVKEVPTAPAPEPRKEITTNTPSPVSQQDPPKKEPKPVKEPPKQAEPKKEDPSPVKETPTPTTAPAAKEPSDNPSDNPAGSNQGNEDGQTGNAGTPDIKVLDPDGLYSFGTGAGGLKGRAPKNLEFPVYDSQEEGQLEFVFQIEEDGSVRDVKGVGLTNKPELRRAGIEAIRKWRFSPLEAGQSGRQEVRVTIKFRLRG